MNVLALSVFVETFLNHKKLSFVTMAQLVKACSLSLDISSLLIVFKLYNKTTLYFCIIYI